MTIGRALEQTIYVVEETTKGTLVYPTAANEKVIGAGYGEINQQPTFTNSENIVNSLDVLERFQDMVGAGTFTIPLYFSPSGSLGSVPMGKVLFESLMGTETINASTSVVYSQATTKPSFSLWVQRGHTLFFARGACVSSARINATNKGGAMVTFSGGFMEMGWAGTSTVDGAVSSSSTVVVATGTGKYFTAGAHVKFATDDNSNAGYEIDSISGDTLTMVDTVSISDGAAIVGFLPVNTAVGTPLENRKTAITFDAVAQNIKSLDITINSPVVYLENEITTTNYPADYIEDRRDISGTVNLVFRAADVKYFKDAYDTNMVAIVITIGDTSGDKVQIGLPTAQLEVPNVSTDGPALALAIGVIALGSGNGENSATITFI